MHVDTMENVLLISDTKFFLIKILPQICHFFKLTTNRQNVFLALATLAFRMPDRNSDSSIPSSSIVNLFQSPRSLPSL
jgi:hypothetical protein